MSDTAMKKRFVFYVVIAFAFSTFAYGNEIASLPASGGKVILNWDDNAENDLAGYNVYRSTLQTGPFSIIAADVATSYYEDMGVVNGGAVNLNDLQMFVGQWLNVYSCGLAILHVESIVAGTSPGTVGRKRLQATVTVYDTCGDPVEGTLVTGTFDDIFNEQQTATTDASGIAVLTTVGQISNPAFTFCVDDITHSSLTYDAASDVESYDSH